MHGHQSERGRVLRQAEHRPPPAQGREADHAAGRRPGGPGGRALRVVRHLDAQATQPRRDRGLDRRGGQVLRRPPVRARRGAVPGGHLGQRVVRRPRHGPRHALAAVGSARRRARGRVGAEHPPGHRVRDARGPEPVRRAGARVHPRRHRPGADLRGPRDERDERRPAGHGSADRRREPAPHRGGAGHLDEPLRADPGAFLRGAPAFSSQANVKLRDLATSVVALRRLPDLDADDLPRSG